MNGVKWTFQDLRPRPRHHEANHEAKPMNASPRVVELWLTLLHGALCRQVAGGLLAQLPADAKAVGAWNSRQLGLVFDGTDREQLEQEAQKLFGSASQLVTVANDLRRRPPGTQLDGLSLRRVVSELQSHLVDEGATLPADAKLFSSATASIEAGTSRFAE